MEERCRAFPAVAALAFGLVCGLAGTPARADCQPNPASSGQTVTCTGTAPNGFQAGAGINNLTVNVLAGATVFDNGAVAIGVNDFNTVTNAGTLSPGAGLIGINAGNNNVITNTASGLITTDGGTGIQAGGNNVITNKGKIATGDFGSGITVGNNSTVTNTGTITAGLLGLGIQVVDGNTVFNFGRITLGAGGAGIIVPGSNNNVTNTGAITVGDAGLGIGAFGFNNLITNNGTVTVGNASGSPAAGIVIGVGGIVSNNGTVSAGDGSIGISGSQNSTIINNGTVNVGAATLFFAGIGINLPAFGSNNVVINNGQIAVGNGSTGILASDGNFIANNGTITAGSSKFFTPGVGVDLSVGTGNVFVNNGRVAVGADGVGRATGFGNLIINNGSVFAGANGVSIGTCFVCFFPSVNNTVINNGTLDGQVALLGVANQLINAGLITVTDPGTPVGVPHEVGGSFIQTATGTLALRVNAAGVSDQLFAQSAHLAGTLLAVVQPGLYNNVTVYNGVVVACTCNGLFGTKFDTVATTSIFFTATATYDYAGVTAPIFDPNVTLTLTRIPFGAVPGETPNQQAVGNALEAAYSTTLTGNAANFYINLLQLTSIKVLDQLSGEGTSGTEQTAFNAQNPFISTLMGQGRCGFRARPNSAPARRCNMVRSRPSRRPSRRWRRRRPMRGRGACGRPASAATNRSRATRRSAASI